MSKNAINNEQIDKNVNKKQTGYLNFIRIFAILCVILLHSYSNFLLTAEFYLTKTWLICAVFNAITRAGVPLFFMISGYLLLNSPKTLDFFKFYKKRFANILLPFAFWEIFYFIYAHFTEQTELSLKNFLVKLFANGSYYHLWYVYTTIALYLFAPFLKRIVDSCNEKQIIGFLSFIAICPVLRPVLNLVLPINIYLFEPPINGAVAYFLFGYILGKFEISKKIRAIIYTLGLAGFIYEVCRIIAVSNTERINGDVNAEYGLWHFLVAGAIFIFAKNFKGFKSLSAKSSHLLAYFSSLIYGVYLMHAFILDLIKRNFIIENSAISIIIKFTGTALISFAIAFILSKIKFVNKIII